jgi:hypothetical protein
MITIVPTPQGHKPVVESVQIYDKHVVDTTSDHLGGFCQKKIHKKSSYSTSESDTSHVKRRTNPNVAHTERKIRPETTFGDSENDPKIPYDDEMISLYDRDEDNYEHGTKDDEKSKRNGVYWIARVLFCDQYRTKSKKKCCPWTIDFSAFQKDVDKKHKIKGRNYMSDYDRTVENPNDQLSIDVNDRKRFWRGNFFILLCDFIVLLSIALVLIGIYLSLDVELDSYLSAQNVALVVAAFKLTEMSSGFVGYINLIIHSTIYRGDIVKIVGTWTGIGGSISGVVLDINISDILLLANTPFVPHYGVKPTTDHETNTNHDAKKSKKSQKTIIKKPPKTKKNIIDDDDINKNEDGQTSHTRRYLPLHTATSAPKLRGKMTEDQLKKLATDFGGRYEKINDHPSLDRAHVTTRPRSDDIETIGYIRFDQKDVETQDENVNIVMERTMNDIEIVRLNTNLVFTSVITRKLGFETNMHISFDVL